MKKNVLTLAAIALLAGAVVFTSCKKDDVTAPVVTLNGSDVTISLQQTYNDLGATANDSKDGKIEPVMSGLVNKDLAGVYTIEYKATDAAGNEGKATRIVTVVNEAAAYFESKYDGSETDVNGAYTYSGNIDPAKVVKVTASTTVNNEIWINRLGDFTNNTVRMNVVGNNITIPQQNVTSVGTGTANCNVHDRSVNGTGMKAATGFTLTYSDAKVAPCTGSRSGVTAVFVKK